MFPKVYSFFQGQPFPIFKVLYEVSAFSQTQCCSLLVGIRAALGVEGKENDGAVLDIGSRPISW